MKHAGMYTKQPRVAVFLSMAATAVFAATTQAFSPLEMDGLALWLDASDTATITRDADDLVSEWADKSGNNYDATQLTANLQPLYVEDVTNNMAGIRFNGHYLDTSCFPATGGNPRTLVAVLANVGEGAGTGFEHVLHYGTLGVGFAYGICSKVSTYTWGNHYWNTSFNTQVPSTTEGMGWIVMASYSNGVDRFYLNGGAAIPNPATLSLDTGNVIGLRIGDRINPGEAGNFDALEILAFSDELSYEDRLRLEGWLAHKWGLAGDLPDDHPYKDTFDIPYFPGPSFTISDTVTLSTAFTSSNAVAVASLGAPAGYDRWMITESGEAGTLASGTWADTAAMPAQAPFTRPAQDADIRLYAWFTNSMDAAMLRRNASQVIRYTESTPVVASLSTYSRGLPYGGTCVVEASQLDNGTTGGTSSGPGLETLAIPLAALEVSVIDGPGADSDNSAETVTLTVAGTYTLRFTARNGAGNEASATVQLTVTQSSSGPYVWEGTVSSSWIEPANWNHNAMPPTGADIIVPAGTANAPSIPAGTHPAAGAYGSLVVSANAVVTCLGDPAVVNEASGGTVAVPHGIGVTLNCASAVIAGTLTADGQGFPEQSGPAGNREGANHGGVKYGNDNFTARPGGSVYGSVTQPTALGSGGLGTSGSGGGAIKLGVAGTLQLDGLITAKGLYRAAGGSIWLEADVFTGTGQINAEGNAGGQGAGGGRVALDYGTSTFTGTLSIKGGDNPANSDGSTGTLWEPKRYENKTGAPGAPVDITVTESFSYVFPDDTMHYWNLTMANGARVEFHDGRLTIGTLTLDNASILRFDNWFTGCPDDMQELKISRIQLAGNSVLCLPSAECVASYDLDELIIPTGSSVYTGWGDFTAINEASGGTESIKFGAGTTIHVSNATINGLLTANGRGFGANAGGIYDGEGSGHGGRTKYKDGYGSLVRPTTLGAGRYVAGGGGALKLVVPGTLTFGGVLSADASDGRSAGGSVWIQAGTITGTGLVSANGGTDMRPGGGGRVAVETAGPAFTGKVSVNSRATEHDVSHPGTIFLCSLPTIDAFGGNTDTPDLDATYVNSIGNVDVFPENVLVATTAERYNITNALVVARNVSYWNPRGCHFVWTERCEKLLDASAVPNTVTYTFANVHPDAKYLVMHNNGLLDNQRVWLSDNEGTLVFPVTLDEGDNTVEVKSLSVDRTLFILR